MKPKRPSSKRRSPSRQRLIEAASRVFARDGLDGATTRAIAKEAKVNEVTLFRQFGSKERLIEAVVSGAFGAGPAAGYGGSILATENLRADLTRFARRYEALLMEHLNLIRAVIGGIHGQRDVERHALNGIFRPMRASLITRLELARARNEVSWGAAEPPVAADLFSGMIFMGVLVRTLPLTPREYAPADAIAASVDVMIRGIAITP